MNYKQAGAQDIVFSIVCSCVALLLIFLGFGQQWYTEFVFGMAIGFFVLGTYHGIRAGLQGRKK